MSFQSLAECGQRLTDSTDVTSMTELQSEVGPKLNCHPSFHYHHCRRQDLVRGGARN